MNTIHKIVSALRKIFSRPVIVLTLMIGILTIHPVTTAAYVCGDNNGDGTVDVGDAVHLIQFVFAGGPAGQPMVAGDANCDGGVNVGDAVCVINYVFRAGPQPCSICPAIDQRILFEMSFANYAWGRVFKGFYIDDAGNVVSYTYTVDIPDAAPWSTPYTEEQLMERYSQNPEPVCVVPDWELYHHFALISAAAAGPISSPAVACFDAGIAYYVAYIYDSESRLYQPVLLYQMGDIAQKNFAPEAETVFYWMMSLVGYDPDQIFCGYPE
jgi:hypothetical protein